MVDRSGHSDDKLHDIILTDARFDELMVTAEAADTGADKIKAGLKILGALAVAGATAFNPGVGAAAGAAFLGLNKMLEDGDVDSDNAQEFGNLLTQLLEAVRQAREEKD